MANRSYLIFFIATLTFASLMLSLCKGSTSIPLYQLFFSPDSEMTLIFFNLRLPHTAAAFITGALLALAGALLQLLLRNPLADPYVLGVSSSASLFVLISMVCGLGTISITLAAWAGSLVAIGLMILFSRQHQWQSHTLLLSGVALASGFSAISSFILLLCPNDHLHGLLFWLTGDLTTVTFPTLALCILIVGAVVCQLLAGSFNLLLRGDVAAEALGLATRRFRIALYLLSALFTATAVTLGGAIGFVGLIIPHFTRLLIQSDDQRLVLPLSMLLGGTLLTIADTVARTLVAPTQLPVGLMTTALGVPLFIGLLQRSGRMR